MIMGFSLYAYKNHGKGSPSGEEQPLNIESMQLNRSKVQKVMDNKDLYPDRLLVSLERNPELVDFALNYPEKQGTSSHVINLSNRYKKGQIPLLMQWDQDWGYAPYGKGNLGLDGCGPTCLSMVAIGLTGDLSLNPKVVAAFSEESGYLDKTNDITLWTLMSEGAGKLGLRSKEIPLDENIISRELSQGHPIICSVGPGDFTTTGHFIVIHGYEDGNFLVNDPNSKSRSQEKWSYENLKPQIKNLWAFSE